MYHGELQMEEVRPNYLSKDKIFNTRYYVMPKISNWKNLLNMF